MDIPLTPSCVKGALDEGFGRGRYFKSSMANGIIPYEQTSNKTTVWRCRGNRMNIQNGTGFWATVPVAPTNGHKAVQNHYMRFRIVMELAM